MSARPANVPSSTSLNGARWRRSSRSTGMNNCVEAALLDSGLLAVRDSKRVNHPALLFEAGAWTCFLASVPEAAVPGTGGPGTASR
ncbi:MULTISPECIES: DUF397 domain-containing protein [unclassified Streptomyces]|uniref:DUF397 domain-containing protein n=1 Tax=unclassified Streptomyces TaxID=2593676 RepID=UPI002E137CF3|nr:DUF397 domain-containing protein [Streptomyces sp. NBC_01197]WSS47763.1 DUF397 domain-containing protein [Streptomyces sp. NBC_01180]